MNLEWMNYYKIISKGESRWPVDLPLNIEKLAGGKRYWMERCVPGEWDGSETIRLPFAPFETREAGEAFLAKNWPAWLGECDVYFAEEQMYVCDDEGEPVYGCAVYAHELYQALYEGVNMFHRESYFTKAEGFYCLLVWTKTLSAKEAREIVEFLKQRKLKWIADEPARLAARDPRKLFGLRGVGPQDREADLVPYEHKLCLNAGALIANANLEAMTGSAFGAAISDENTWVRPLGDTRS